MFRSATNFDKHLDKATSQLLLEPDWSSILQVCDCIRQGDVNCKTALASMTRKINDPNPNVGLYALQVLESCVKNCGTPFHEEVATKQFMENLHELVKQTGNEKIRAKIIELVQIWAHAFRNEPKFRAVQDNMNIMKAEGYQFPTLKESDAMFSADSAPKWAEGDCCHICRAQFSFLKRKHHCRACGQVFCDACSSHSVTLPKFGFEKEVRVCDNCFEQFNKPGQSLGSKGDSDSSNLSSQHSSPVKKNKDLEASEEEELQLAIALSKSEAEEKEKEKLRQTHTLLHNFGNSENQNISKPEPKPEPVKTSGNEEMDPELARYLNRSYWEQKKTFSPPDKMKGEDNARPTAPIHGSEAESSIMKVSELKLQGNNGDSLDEFISTLRSQIEIFVNRMKSNSDRGRSIANDSSVQTLFMNITAMHSTLLRYIQEQDDMRVYYEALQDKLTQIRDARAALDALRDEHRDKLRREAEEAQRSRQLQMAQKLELMRIKKQEYLEYQRQLALKQMLEKEREMQFRLEHQKQQYLHMGGMVPGSTGGYPAGHVVAPGSGQVPPPPFIQPQGVFADPAAYPQVSQASYHPGGPYSQPMNLPYAGPQYERAMNPAATAPGTAGPPGALPPPGAMSVPPQSHGVPTNLPAQSLPQHPLPTGPGIQSHALPTSLPPQPHVPPPNMNQPPCEPAPPPPSQPTAELISFD